MEAGRELDALVAEKIMGWKWYTIDTFAPDAFLRHPEHVSSPDWYQTTDEYRHPQWVQSVWHYSTDISSAWLLAEKLRIAVMPDENNGWIAARWSPDETYYDIAACESHANTAPLAICLAALKAVGVAIPE